MPEGSEDQQNFIAEPPDETASLLVADKARSAGELRTGAANDNYEPYSKEPANDNNIPNERAPEQNTEAQYQAQLADQQQAEVAIAMAAGKQRQLLAIQKQKQMLEEKLGELEKNLTDFKKSSLGGMLSIFQPGINTLIDSLIDQLKKQGSRLSDEAKVAYYTGLITTASSLIAILTALKLLTAVLDAAFFDAFSCLRLIITTFATCVVPIFLILISPIYIPFLAILFIIGKIPLLKGILTKNIISLIEKLKKQRTAWQAEVEDAKKKVILRRQIKDLTKAEKTITRGR